MNYLKFKKPYYECITNLFLGMVAEEEEKMGERVAYFELASEKLNAAFHYFKYIDVLPLNKVRTYSLVLIAIIFDLRTFHCPLTCLASIS